MINELEALYRIQAIKGIGNKSDQKLLLPVIEQISQKICKDSEMPDIYGDGFGLEHTEISPFYRHRKKGDSFQRFKNIFKENINSVDLPLCEFYYLDLPSFTKKLGISSNNCFMENTVKAINEKSNKFLKYTHYEINGLWLSFSNDLSFTKHEPIHFLLQEPIYQALMDSPFEFFLFGNEYLTTIISKEEIEHQYEIKESNSSYILTLTESDTFPLFQIKCKALPKHMESERIEMGGDLQDGLYKICDDINIPHFSRLFIKSEHDCNQPPLVKFFSDDVELDVIKWSEDRGTYEIIFTSPHLSGQLTTDFKDKVNLSFKDLSVDKGETIKGLPSQHDDTAKQKILSGTKRFFLYSERFVNIYTTPPFIVGDLNVVVA